MARRPNYRLDRAERERRKLARRDERLAAKADRRERRRPTTDDEDPATVAATTAADPVHVADAAVIGRLAQALAFVCGPEHAVTRAVAQAAASGSADDRQRALTLFLRLDERERHAALTIAAAHAPTAS